MAPKVKIEGTVDSKPLPPKVHDALKSSIEHELTIIKPTHHVNVTHIDITFNDKV